MSHHSFIVRRCMAGTADAERVERLVHHMPTVARLAKSEWGRGFAQSILKQSRRKCWHPTPKQEAAMSRLVADLFTNTDEEGDVSLIE